MAVFDVRLGFAARMMQRLRRLYPFLFVILPILNVLTRNPGGSTVADAGGLMLVMLAACAVLYAVALAVRPRGGKAIVPLMVLAVIIWFYSYPAIRSAYNLSRGSPGQMLLTAGAVLALLGVTVAGVWWLPRRPILLERANTFFAITALLLVAFSGVRIVSDRLQARSQLNDSTLAAELGRPVSPQGAAAPIDSKEPYRDIYLIVLDEYTSSAVMRERFGFDNRIFEDSLRKLGFTLPRLARSNYVHTLLSLPSLLNFSHLSGLEAEVGPRETDPTIPNYLVENNRTASFLKTRGYRYVLFPSQWWISTQQSRIADSTFQAWNGFDLARESSRSDLRRAFIGNTPLALLHRSDRHDADHVRRTLRALEQLPGIAGPTFAFAHILNPHYPYVFDADCRVHRTRPGGRWAQGRQKAYLGQVQCLNQLLLRTVTQLLRHSKPAPVILLVGDHGTNSLGYSDADSAAAVSPAQATERFGVFGAFYLPAGGESAFADSVTLVNVIPRVLNFYFGAGIALPPDSLYMSMEKSPYLFAPVDPASLPPGM